MIKKTLLSALLLVTVFSAPSTYAEEIKVISDEAKLRKITDTYRSDPNRPKDFIPQGNGTVIDKRTGLQWMRCSLGQVWTGKTCKGEPSQYTWNDANNQQIDFAGYNDWRLPTIWELETLVFCSSGKDKGRIVSGDDKLIDTCDGAYQKPTIVRSVFHNTGGKSYPRYWSSSLSDHIDNKPMAQFIFFYEGCYLSIYTSDTLQVRLVRTPK